MSAAPRLVSKLGHAVKFEHAGRWYRAFSIDLTPYGLEGTRWQVSTVHGYGGPREREVIVGSAVRLFSGEFRDVSPSGRYAATTLRALVEAAIAKSKEVPG